MGNEGKQRDYGWDLEKKLGGKITFAANDFLQHFSGKINQLQKLSKCVILVFDGQTPNHHRGSTYTQVVIMVDFVEVQRAVEAACTGYGSAGGEPTVEAASLNAIL